MLSLHAARTVRLLFIFVNYHYGLPRHTGCRLLPVDNNHLPPRTSLLPLLQRRHPPPVVALVDSLLRRHVASLQAHPGKAGFLFLLDAVLSNTDES